MMFTVSPELYHQVATRLADAIDGGNYYSGSLDFTCDGLQFRLTSSVIVYRDRVCSPEGSEDAICDLVPVWWEFHTTGDAGEMLNDFEFSRLKDYL